MTEGKFDFRDPRRLFELWKELTGEDLFNKSLKTQPDGKSGQGKTRSMEEKQHE